MPNSGGQTATQNGAKISRVSSPKFEGGAKGGGGGGDGGGLVVVRKKDAERLCEK